MGLRQVFEYLRGGPARFEAMTKDKTNAAAVLNPPFTFRAQAAGLRDMGATARAIGAYQSDGAFVMPTQVASGQPYNIFVFTQPTGPVQVCNVANGAGTVAPFSGNPLAVISEGTAYLHVGGAIVADSGVRAEYDESLLKARTVARALGAACP